MSRAHFLCVAGVSYTSNIPEHEIGDYSAFCVERKAQGPVFVLGSGPPEPPRP